MLFNIDRDRNGKGFVVQTPSGGAPYISTSEDLGETIGQIMDDPDSPKQETTPADMISDPLLKIAGFLRDVSFRGDGSAA